MSWYRRVGIGFGLGAGVAGKFSQGHAVFKFVLALVLEQVLGDITQVEHQVAPGGIGQGRVFTVVDQTPGVAEVLIGAVDEGVHQPELHVFDVGIVEVVIERYLPADAAIVVTGVIG